MRNSKNKILAIAIMILLTASIMLLTTANAHSPAWQIPTHAFIVVAPNPIGVGQEAHVYMWLAEVFGAAGGTTATTGTNGSTASAALLSNNYRFHNYQLTITDPNGTKTTQTFDIIWDTTSSQFTKFIPDKVGTYTFNFTFPGQAYAQYAGQYYEKSILVNDTYLPSSASTTLTVQEEPLPAPITSYPLPKEYWTRPIYGENTDWWKISSNWLGYTAPVPGGYDPGTTFGRLFHKDAVGPLTSHVMWTRALQFGGVVGGNQFYAGGSYPEGDALGVQYFEGTSYQPRFPNPLIINGYLIYTEPVALSGPTSGPRTCIDMRSGKVLWSRTDVPPLSFGYIYNLWDPDQHGVFPPYLFTANFARCFDAYTGNQLFNVTGVPTGTAVLGPNGEHLRYVISNAGTAANPQWYLAQWNSSRLWQYDINPYTGGGSLSPSIINASNGVLVSTVPIPLAGTTGTIRTTTGGTTVTVPYGSTLTVNANIPINSTTVGGVAGIGIATYDWNISLPWLNTMPVQPVYSTTTGQTTPAPAGTNPVTIVAAKYGDMLLCRNGSLPTGFGATRSGYPQLPYTFFVVNLNASKGAIGSIRWMKTYDPPAGNITLVQGPTDFETGVFIFNLQETMQWDGYSLTNGQNLWGPTAPQTTWDYYGYPGTTTLPGTVAYGKLYCSSFGGICYCYDDTTGKILWTYGNGGEGNSTFAGLTVFYGNWPTMIQSIANDVIYLATDEHTMPNPFYKGCVYTAINASTGEEIWKLSGYCSEWSTPGSAWATADGYIACMNGLDNNVYSIGRGPSATTVTAPNIGVSFGTSIVLKGTVIDTSPGTKQDTQAARFPNGVPCASDKSMTDWMGYVYQQKPLPTNFTGVDVVIDVLDSNGNYRNIGTATTDSSGTYRFTWTPDIPGDYIVIASFQGTNGYWPSYAEEGFTVMEPGATASPYPVVNLPPTEMYFAISTIAIIIAIAIATLLLLRKKP